MRPILAPLLKDWYKAGHIFQYPQDTTLVYSNNTPRGTRLDGIEKVVAFGFQYLRDEYLIDQFNDHFFDVAIDDALTIYKRRCKNAIGDLPSYTHIADLHDLGYLPLHVKALPEGTLCPMRVPFFTIHNTLPEFFWLTNMLETLISNVTWGPITSATIAYQYRKIFEIYAKATGGPKAFVPWQGHDFSMRGMFGLDAAITSGAAHLLSFTGTDTIPAIDFLELYYGADSDTELVGGSVPATEHSVMCAGGEEDELGTLKRLITEVYPIGIISVVSDTWDFWKVLTDYLPKLREVVRAREGKLVIRPDSGDPVKVICGDPEARPDSPEGQGAIRLLHSVFGGVTNAAGYIELDPHIGLIYGDSITLDRQKAILEGLKQKGFASTNVVFGIGSYTYQHQTRDTFGQAIKATYVERRQQGLIQGVPIFKKPKTDDGLKNSAKGLLQVRNVNGNLSLIENVDWAWEGQGELQTIFLDGDIQNTTTLKDIRARIEAQLAKELEA